MVFHHGGYNCPNFLSLLFAGGLQIAISTIALHLDLELIRLKKFQYVPDRRNAPETKRQRQEFVEKVSELEKTHTLVFLDETSFNLWTQPRWGRPKRGERSKLLVPNNKSLLVRALVPLPSRLLSYA